LVPSSGGEREFLQSQIEYLEQELAEVRKRLKDIEPVEKSA
jgi:prefoldin subunit 5